jgi:ATP-binding cassette subfamily A (ABC1) protein 3
MGRQYQSNITEFAQYLLRTAGETGIPRYGAWYVNGPALTGTSSMDMEHYTIFVNTSATHALPTLFNWLSNARLQLAHSILAQPTVSIPHIRVTQAPLPLSGEVKVIKQASSSLLIGIAFAFVPASLVGWIVKERQTNVKHLQMISGVSVTSYWVSTLIWDFITSLVSTCEALLRSHLLTPLALRLFVYR